MPLFFFKRLMHILVLRLSCPIITCLRKCVLQHERTAMSTQVWEPCHVTIKRNPSASPKGWCWRLSVWKFFQSHFKSSRTPLNPRQLHTIQEEKLWDSSESSKMSSSCQNEPCFNIQGSAGSFRTWLRSKRIWRKMRFMARRQKPLAACWEEKWMLVWGLPKST